ncbi:heme biosynthesis protein HemY [Oceaniradius stylonematis]|uniref:Heme biosynthesis protein HemY n=1 Tax=Oceaniradius stylonematis TaxID=2184161 RepID=A0A3A8ADN0_9HYPH|nr:heme biosynthesis protein HemY [Oceaniradius stylonematis]RKF07458.1 heme biosynthesis protein HemY [Oceaniradius stylonematis]
MIKVLIFIALVFALGFGFAWLADMPGDVAVTVGDQLIHVSLMVAAVGVVSIVAAIMLTWWIIRVVFTSPERLNRFFRARKRDRGYQSLSTGIIAAGSGDPATSRRMLKQAGGLLNETTEPLIQLLDAQTTLLEGKHGDARQKFEAMLEDPELRLLGLRGLYMEAQRLGDREAQKHYAEKAAELGPQLIWAGKAAIDLKTASGDWDGAIRLLEKQKAAKHVAREDADRKRAVLLTALAMDNAESDPAKSKQAALEAHRLAPGFAPAAVTAAEAAFRLNEMRRGVKVLETCWRKAPHPDVALAYVNARPGDSALDRLKRARRLEAIKPNTTESSLIVAQMALEAGEFEQARKSVAAVLRNQPRESAFMLMADIEDAETGDQGKVREWLSRAVRAARDPAWTADGIVAEKWSPFSPVTGRIDAFEWKVPVERTGALIENDLDPMVPGTPADAGPSVDAEETVVPALPVVDAQPEPQADAAPVKTIGEPVDLAARVEAAREERTRAAGDASDETPAADTETAPESTGMDEDRGTEDKAKPAPAIEMAAAAAASAAMANGKAGANDPARAQAGTSQPPAEPAPAAPAADPPAKPADKPDVGVKADADTGEQAPLKPPIPDDPGVEDGEPDKPRRFRLF